MTDQATLFRWLRTRMVAHGYRVLWNTAKARLATMMACSLVIAAVVFAVGLEGFVLMNRQNLPGSGLIVGLLFDFLFLTLGLMLIFSGGLILYASLFASAETAFLLALPARADRIFAYKFQGAVGFSSWAFVLLGLPVLGAFGIVYRVNWLYWPAVPLFLAGFILIPGSIGALGCFAIVSTTPRRRKQVLAGVLAVLAAVIVYWGYQVVGRVSGTIANADRDAVTGLLGQFAFARAAWMPGHWMTRGLQAAARGDLVETAFPLALVWSHGLLLYLLAAATSVALYRRGYNRLASGGGIRKRYGGGWLDSTLSKALGFLDAQTRHLIIKDFRTFRRDPAQWAQVVIFAGLGLTYFANSRQFYRSDLGRSFQHGVALVNVLATSMLMCAYMGRFIYPMLSLEGRKFWILGLMPLERGRLLRGKFAFAAVGSLLISVPLVVISDLFLGLGWLAVALHALTVAIVSAGLSGLAVGIGALLPNFRETDPSKIAVGFGGTMNLLAGLLFLLVEIGLMAGPYHLTAMFWPDSARTGLQLGLHAVTVIIAFGIAAAATLLPLRAGTRSLERMEF